MHVNLPQEFIFSYKPCLNPAVVPTNFFPVPLGMVPKAGQEQLVVTSPYTAATLNSIKDDYGVRVLDV
jgi:hypothetical protein